MISHCLGAGERDKARQCAAFCIWTATVISIVYGILILSLRSSLFPAIGADDITYPYTAQYVFWTVTIGAAPTVFNPMVANLIRAEGYSRQASFGVALGGFLNIVLDPIFIFTFRMRIAGAAIATMLSALTSSIYFLLFLRSKRAESVITVNPKYYPHGWNIPAGTLAIGLPNFVISFMATLSNAVLNPLVASCSNKALAGIGIAKKIDLLAFAIAQGMTQGALPLISYSHASGNRKRMTTIIRTTIIYGLIIAFSGMTLLLLIAGPISRLFIADVETAAYSRYFLRVIALTCPTTLLILVIISVFQATGRKFRPLFISSLRKGVLDIPMMFILNHFWGINGIVWAVPCADLGALIIAIILCVPLL